MENASIIWLGPLKIALFGISMALAFLASSFYFWRLLREDYHQDEEELLRYVLWVTLAGFLGSRILYILFNFSDFGLEVGKWFLFNLYPGFSVFGAIASGVVLTFLWIDKKRWDLYLILDTVTISALIALIVGSFGVMLSSLIVVNIVKFIFWIFILSIALFFQKNYRKFIWYKSGKLGFVFSSVLSLAGIGLFAVELVLKSDIYLESLSNLILFFGGLIILYQRSQRNIKEDLGFLKKINFRKNK